MKNNNIKTKTIAAVLAAITTVSTLGGLCVTSVSAAGAPVAVSKSLNKTPEDLAKDIEELEEVRKKAQDTTIVPKEKEQKSEKEKELEKKAKKEEARKEKENKEINEKTEREDMIVDTILDFTEDLLKTYIGVAYKKIVGKSDLTKFLKKKGDSIVGKLVDNKKDNKLSKDTQAIIENISNLENLMSDNQEQTTRGIDAIIDSIKSSRFKNVYSDLENDYNFSLKQVSYLAKQLYYIKNGKNTDEHALNIKARLATHDPHKMCRLFNNFYTELNKETVKVNGEKRSAALEQYIKNRISEVRRNDNHIFSENSLDYNNVRSEINKELELMAQLSVNDYYVIKLYLNAYKSIIGIVNTGQTTEAIDAIENDLDNDFMGVINYIDRSWLNEDTIKAEVKADGFTKGYFSFADAYSAAFSAEKSFIKLNGDVNVESKEKKFNVNGVSAAKGFDGVNGLLVNDKKEITIDCNGHTINGRNKDITMFKVSPSCKLTIKNGTFKNIESLIVYKSDKAVSTEIKLENVNVIDSKKSVVQLSDNSKNAKFIFEKCTFENVEDGAAIYADYMNPNAIVIKGCTFINCNNSLAGGAVSLDTKREAPGYFSVSDCVFKNNSSKAEGGAAYHIDAKNCKFYGNKAKTGGAVFGTRTLEDCLFEGNSSMLQGGAVMFVQNLVKNCTFKNNKGTYGGALYTSEKIKLENVIMIGNSAEYWGGGAYLVKGGSTIEGVTCTGNKAGYYGGGVALESSTGYYIIKNSKFTENKAGIEGGGVYCNTLLARAADVKLEGIIRAFNNKAGSDEKGDDFFLENGAFNKSKLYATEKFNADNSNVKVTSNSKGEIAVCELSNPGQKKAFSSSDNRSVYTGYFYNKTVYIGKA